MWNNCHVNVQNMTVREYMDHTGSFKMGIHSKKFNTFKFNNNYSRGRDS